MLVLFLIYIAVGFISTLYFVYESDKKGETSPFLIFGGDVWGMLAWFALWPVFVIVAKAELAMPTEKKKEVQQAKKKTTIGERGVTETQMLPAGKVKVNGQVIDAYSLSGALESGEQVEIVSKEMSHYKVKRVK
ncbi:NfeD family protein [Rubellicoccus peritrichatus]|uniref:NfeD family protein n=1 Tax=Rubellicoccus peritrichatus TaxID=3080537 RepID=A0AAQ3QVK7_9BACT|nr:NfeD family protein [Puniceicoccus sp. CR14]WOO40907.1 NfeD family protein [Puniceicoccus sp. CR14]